MTHLQPPRAGPTHVGWFTSPGGTCSQGGGGESPRVLQFRTNAN